MSPARRPFASFAFAIVCAVLAIPGPAQTMIEYGHLGGAAATGAAGARKAAPKGTFKKVGATLSRRSGSPSAEWGARGTAPIRSASFETPPREGLTVLDTQWGPGPEEPAPAAVQPETSPARDVSAKLPEDDSFDLEAAGLRSGMAIAEVSRILGDPAMRTAGLAGRGYDEKTLYRLESGWQVVVYGSRGRALDFLASRSTEKAKESILQGGGSVVP
jgi:hypothetical protein